MRNNLLNSRHFVFPQFDYEKDGIEIHCPAGYLAWSDLHQIFEQDVKLQSNLKKAHKLSYEVLHPGNKKQSVPLALAIFHETTTAAFESYFPEREDASKFLKMINTWWLICNSKEISHPNPLGNAVRVGDGKTDFLEALADWLEKWLDDCPAFALTSKKSYALVLTLRAQSGLIKELLSEGYDFVMTSRLQSDPIERRFSQYRQMSGGRFLVSLQEVTNWERIIRCRSLVKADINFWKEDLGSDKPFLDFSALLALLSEHEIEIAESTLDSSSEEVSTTIAGYIAKKLAKRSNCDSCKSLLIASSMDLAENHCLNLLSRGGLIDPSAKLAEYTSHFLRSWITHTTSFKHTVSGMCGQHILKFLIGFLTQIDICCSKHNNWGLKFAAKIVINTFFNSKQTVSSDSARKDTVVAFKKRQRTK